MTTQGPRVPWIRRAFRLPTTATRAREELDAELRFHLQERIEEMVAGGMSREDAEHEARRRFGDVDGWRRATASIDQRMLRRRGRAERVDAGLRELRRAARALARSPAYSVVAVLTLALGIGATTAIFTLLDRVVLRPLPYPTANRMVDVRSAVAGKTSPGYWGVSVAGYFEYRRHNHSLDDLAALVAARPSIVDATGAERLPAAVATASIAPVLGLHAAVGRLFGPSDDRPGAPSVAVLGHGIWERRYGADPTIVGSTIDIEGQRTTIIGVMDAGMELPDQQVDLWLPLGLDSLAPPVNDHGLRAIGVLKRGIAPTDAQRDLAALTARFPELFPGAYSQSFMTQYRFNVNVVPTREEVLGNIGRVLWMLLASVALVLLIACANVANLQLARLQTRRREVAVRTALGASRGDLLWHHLSESLLLSSVAGAVGLALAWSGIHALLSIAPSSIPRLAEVRLDPTAVGFGLALSLVIALAFGLAPALRRAESDLGTLREGARGATASRGQRVRRDALVIAQVALAFVLLAAAGLLTDSVRVLHNVRPGFDARDALSFDIALPSARYRDHASVEAFYRQLAARLAALPGVSAVGFTESLPLDPESRNPCALVFTEDRPLASGEEAPCVGRPLVSPGYFAAMDIPVRGATPDWSDMERHTAGVVVSAALARRLWPGANPIGKGINAGGRPPFYRVVGVAADVRGAGLDKPPTEAVYYPLMPITGSGLWGPPTEMSVVVRTLSRHPESLAPSIRRAVADLDRNVPTANMRPLDAVVARSMARVSFAMLLLAIAAAMALLLSAVGMYGVIAYLVSQRRGEIGVRIALGARPAQVSGAIVLQALGLGMAGSVLGVLGALGASRLLHSLLAGLAPSDSRVLVMVVLLVLTVVALASFWPARRAASVSPVEALRAE